MWQFLVSLGGILIQERRWGCIQSEGISRLFSVSRFFWLSETEATMFLDANDGFFVYSCQLTCFPI